MVKILGADGQSVSGSGFIIRSDGYLITCHHVIYLLDSLKVEYQRQIYDAEWCQELSNPEFDIAILKINVEDAKAVPIINPQDLSTSVTVYGFPPSQKKYFPEGIAVSTESIRRSAPLNTVSTYRTREIKSTNPWNILPKEESTFLSHRIDAKVDSGTSGGAVFAEELGGVVGVIQCSKSDESYVIRWDNITEYLDKLGLEPEKNAVCHFLEEIENNFKYDKLLHIPEQPIVLKDQYIPIQVTLERKYTHAVETTWGYAESEAEMKRAYALKGLEESQPSPVDWKEAKKQHQRIIVLADPGMGKSTLLRREACLTAQEERQSLKDNTKKLEEVVFPLFLRLSDLAETPEEIIDAIPVLIQRDYSDTATEVMELLREKLKIGKCLLLLDALDEVPPEQRQRQRLFEKLNRFAEREYPCRIICTSRIVGYSGAFVQGTKEVEIVPFSRTQTEQYIETWFRNVAGYLNEDTVSASSLIRELRNKPQLGGLAQNPLLLSLICTLYQEKGLTLPARRCQVYEQAVRYMLGKWRKKRNPQSEGRIIAKTRLLEELAYHFTREGQDIFLKDDLYDQIETYLQQERVPTVFRDDDTDKLMMELSEEDGILQKLHEDGDQYLFLHRTFQEYLTACYLNRASDSIALAKEHFWEYEWHETLSLLAGLMENPVPLLQAITAEKDDIFSTLLLLAGRCIAECPENPHPLIAEIIDKIYKFWQSYPNAGFIQSIVVAIGQANSQALQSLQKALDDEDYSVRRQAVEALGKIGSSPTVEALITALKHEDSSVRREAAKALGKIGSSQAEEALIAALKDEDTSVRWRAAVALGWIGSPQVVEELIEVLNEALNDENDRVRRQAAAALGEIGSSQAVAVLIKALNHWDKAVRWNAADALGEIGSPQAVEALITALSHNKCIIVRIKATDALGEIGSPQAVEALITALKDKNENNSVRRKAAKAVGKTCSSRAEEALITTLKDEDSYIKIQVAVSLAEIGKSQGEDVLIAALKDEDSYIKIQVAVSLAGIGKLQGVDVLITVLNDENSRRRIRMEAADALGKIGSSQAEEALITALKNEDSHIKIQVAVSLAEIGKSQGVDVLIEALNHKDIMVRTKAAGALGKIGTPEILAKLIQFPEIDIYEPDIFSLARTLAVRFSKEKRPFIPVYPELVAHKQ